MIEQKIKELLEQYFSNILNWETNKIYFGNSYQLNLIRFEYSESDKTQFDINSTEKEIQNICNKYSTYYVEPEIRMFEKVVQIKLRYFTRAK
jgi:hypothetical protein